MVLPFSYPGFIKTPREAIYWLISILGRKDIIKAKRHFNKLKSNNTPYNKLLDNEIYSLIDDFQFGSYCFYCFKKTIKLEWDCIIPEDRRKARGSNSVLACPKCIKDRSNVQVFEWLFKNGNKFNDIAPLLIGKYLTILFDYLDKIRSLDNDNFLLYNNLFDIENIFPKKRITKRSRRKAKRASVSLGTIVKENLPYPIVHYPNHYGTFFAFSKTKKSEALLCSCSKQAITYLLKLNQKLWYKQKNSNLLREATLNSILFPDIIANISSRYPEDFMKRIKFKEKLCHRCNLSTPTLRYCHEMYGVQFIQSYGWYVNQMYLRLGIDPHNYDYLKDITPSELQIDIEIFKKESRKLNNEIENVRKKISKNKGEVFASSIRPSNDEILKLEKQTRKLTRVFTKKIENLTREEFGIRKVGEGWVSETILYNIAKKIFSGKKIIFHHKPSWLNGLELDIYIPSLKLALEYQGQQHFKPVKLWGGENALVLQKKRDKKKKKICDKEKVKLVEISYSEPLTEEYLKEVLNDIK